MEFNEKLQQLPGQIYSPYIDRPFILIIGESLNGGYRNFAKKTVYRELSALAGSG